MYESYKICFILNIFAETHSQCMSLEFDDKVEIPQLLQFNFT